MNMIDNLRINIAKITKSLTRAATICLTTTTETTSQNITHRTETEIPIESIMIDGEMTTIEDETAVMTTTIGMVATTIMIAITIVEILSISEEKTTMSHSKSTGTRA